MDSEERLSIIRGAVRFVKRRMAALEPRLKAIEERQMTPGPPGDAGRDGKDADEDAILGRLKSIALSKIDEDMQRVVASIPIPEPGKDGRDGVDGKDADPDLVKRIVAETLPGLVERAQAVLSERLEVAIKEIPTPKDGRDGIDGEKGADGSDGRDGIDGKNITVEDVRPLLESMHAKWALDWERSANDLIQRTIDRMPKPKDGIDGKDGRDGFDADDATEEMAEDGRTIIRRYVRGDRVQEFRHKFAVVLDRGVFKDGSAYERGDGVSWAGSFWIAQKDTSDKPGVNDSWRLAVKKGRDAKVAA